MKTSALGKKINPRKKGLSLLDPIKRQKDNIKYGIDIWNVYDFMYLNHNKIPQLVVLEIVIPYESDLIIESKSLKLYLWTFREVGHFCEALASDIAQKLFDTLDPKWVKVTNKQSKRGGIETTSVGYCEQ